MTRSRVRTGSAVAAVLVSLAAACGPSGGERDAGARASRSAVVSDAAHAGEVPGFFWLPPMVPTTAYGTFAPGLAPKVVIDTVPAGATPVATFAASEVKTDLESHYMVNWDTKASPLDPALTYRIRVVLGAAQLDLGYADVDVVASGSELRKVDTGQYIPLLDGRTLPIKFRIEPEALKCVDVFCQALDQCHLAGKCDPLTGVCSNPAKADGAACVDGDLCTRTDTCQAGACVGANPVVCEALDQCHDPGACEPSTGACSDPAKPDDTGCDDDDLCTRLDSCQAGVCTGFDPVTCAALDQCHEPGLCEPFTGLCPDPEKPAGTPCDDGNLCTLTDTCQAGICDGARPVVCTASDQCHDAGVCDPSLGTCSDPPKADGAACDDANACTQTDACQAGACAGGNPVICAASDQCHDAGTCDPANGRCSNPAKPDGAACDDRNACTAAAACDGGRRFCTAADVCTDGVCPRTGDPCLEGLCTDCCSAADACVAGVCRGYAFSCDRNGCWGTGLTCDDGDVCTRNGCDPTATAARAVSGCTYVPDETLDASCAPEPPQQGEPPVATVAIVGLAPATTGLFANQRLDFSVTLTAACDPPAPAPCASHPDYDVELYLFPVTAEDDQNEYPGVPLGTWRIPAVEPGTHAYWVELAIPDALPPGSWEVAVHEYPAGPFFPGESDPPLALTVEAAPELPVLDVTGLQVAQAGVFVDPESAVADPAAYRDTAFAANLEVVSQNYGATGVPVTADLLWNGAPIPLLIWEPAPSGTGGRWVDTLVLTPPAAPAGEPSPWALDPDAPTSIFLELALPSGAAAALAPQIGADPIAAKVMVTVNGDGSVPEAECVVSDPDAPLRCRHSALVDALVWIAPPLPEDAAPLAMMLAAAEAPPVRRYEKVWSKSIGNEWARAGIGFSAFAQLSSAGYEAGARGNVPLQLFTFPEFQFIDANARADALVEAASDGQKAHAVVNVKILGITAYEPVNLAGNSVTVTFSDLVSMPSVQKEKKFEKTVIVYVVPVTFTLGASAEVGLDGTITATFTAGGTFADRAELALTGGPYATAEAFGGAALGAAFLSAGARVTLTLIDASLDAAATGGLDFYKTADLRPYEIRGSLQETIDYSASFLNGRVGLTVTYPTIKWCKVWRFRFPCGFRLNTAEKVLCSWPGFSYGGNLLTEQQTDLFTIDVCEPNRSCAGLCGDATDGCHPCTCPDGVPCDAASGTCGCVLPGMCDGRCGTIADACGAALECGACAGGLVCDAEQYCVSCAPKQACDPGSCGAVDDGCGGTLACGDCPAGLTCDANVCVPAGFTYPGLYDVQHRWGGSYGTWWNESGDSRAQDITVHADGRVFRGGAPIASPTVGATTVSWTMAGGNTSDGNIVFMNGSANTYIWGPGGRTGVLFEGADPGGIRFPGEGWLDFRGVRTCVPTTTCAGKCGTVFDGCSSVDCGTCTCTAPDYRDGCGTCVDRDAAPPVLLLDADAGLDPWMWTSCPVYPLPRHVLVEEAYFKTQAYTSAISDAWVYFHDPSGAIVGSIRTDPMNYGFFERSAVFDPPIAVASVELCSWWNPATLLELDLYGDPAACAP